MCVCVCVCLCACVRACVRECVQNVGAYAYIQACRVCVYAHVCMRFVRDLLWVYWPEYDIGL